MLARAYSHALQYPVQAVQAVTWHAACQETCALHQGVSSCSMLMAGLPQQHPAVLAAEDAQLESADDSWVRAESEGGWNLAGTPAEPISMPQGTPSLAARIQRLQAKGVQT